MAKIDPSGRQVPFFACLSIMLPTDGGKGVLPLFMGLEDANTAIIQVLETKGGNPEEFEVYPMSLGEALDTLIGNPDDQIFRFMAPSTSKQAPSSTLTNLSLINNSLIMRRLVANYFAVPSSKYFRTSREAGIPRNSEQLVCA
jgi:hypothetical protein